MPSEVLFHAEFAGLAGVKVPSSQMAPSGQGKHLSAFGSIMYCFLAHLAHVQSPTSVSNRVYPGSQGLYVDYNVTLQCGMRMHTSVYMYMYMGTYIRTHGYTRTCK